MKKGKLIAIAAIVAALAATGAGWKWNAKAQGHAYGQYRIAGWTWDIPGAGDDEDTPQPPAAKDTPAPPAAEDTPTPPAAGNTPEQPEYEQ